MNRVILLILAAVNLLLSPAGHGDQAPQELWRALRDGSHFAVMRHALAPGTGDPAHFKLDDCSTQRLLSAEGRAQAKRIGEEFRKQGISEAVVYSSQWCRCLETAEYLQLGPVIPLPEVNSFFRDTAQGPAQTQAVKEWLSTPSTERRVIVTHQVNITALTGIYPASGEIVVARIADGGQVQVKGRIRID